MQRLAARWLAAALAVPLVVYAVIGSYSRYTADDYCWAGILRTDGFLDAQVRWYMQYSPRYAFTLVINLVELAGPAIVPFLPGVAIVVFVATLYWTLRQFDLPFALGVAEVIALGTLQTAPDLPQSLYWQTGMLTYLLPLILATFLCGWIRRASRRSFSWFAALVCFVVTFFAGGLAETYLIPQNVGLTLVLAACLWWRKTHVVPYVAAALAGGVLALLAIVLAPATASRVGGTPADLWLASAAAIATAAYQPGHLVRYFALTALLCLAVPALLMSSLARRPGRELLMTSVLVAIILPFCYFPSFYAQNGNPPARSLIVPGFILIAYLAYVGLSLKPWLAKLPMVAALVALSLVPLGIAAFNWPQQALAAQYAGLWDAEDALIRARRDAGDLDPTVPNLPPNFGEQFVTADRADWFNACVARYYGLRSIATG